MILIAENIYLQNAERYVINDVSITINEKDKIAIIGKNGIGKSTFLKAIIGQIELEKGNIIIDKEKTIAYLPQVVEIQNKELTILEYIDANFNIQNISSKIELNKDDSEVDIKAILSKLDIYDLTRKMGTLSGGEKRRVMLAITLAKKCDLLVLDEPTNHLDANMVTWLEKYLIKYNKAFIMVTHDRYFLERTVNKIAELDNGKLSSFSKNYSAYLEMKESSIEFMQSENRKRQSFLRREIEWINRGAQARTTKDKKRIERYEAEREIYKQDNQTKLDHIEIDFSSTPRLGNIIIEVENLNKSFMPKQVIKDFSYIFSKEDRIGIVGKNGMGKTTLLNILAGKILDYTGKVTIGQTVKKGYFTQENDNFDSNEKVIDYIAGYSNKLEASKILENFMFTKEMQYMPISKLSGGEKRRLKLLKVLASTPNVLFLDEPSNDLDIETLNVLEAYIKNFLGPVIIVSHDRYFLDKCVSKIFEISDNGLITRYNGNYTDYINKKEESDINTIYNKKEKQNIQTVIKPKSNKLTFNEKKEYSTIESEIASLEEKQKELDKQINDMYLTNIKNFNEVNELIKEKEELEELILAKYERWEYLSSKEE